MNIPQPPAPAEQTLTKWKNPTGHTVVADIFVGPANVPPPSRAYQRGERHPAHVRYKWGPGEVREVPSMYNDAIHDVRNGVLVGGLAPQLERVDEERLPMAPGIDADDQARTAALREAEIALTAKKVAEESLVIASAKANEAQAAIDANSGEDAKPAKARAPKPQG